jgi:lactoylglutathione lyase
MKRLHVHVAVDDLAPSVRFYSALFAAEPAVLKPDYAKWMLEDPRLNFAISSRGQAVGVNHLGFQVDSEQELERLRERLQRADEQVREQKEQACCYARSNKYWVTDPTGIAWESFHTLETIPLFGEEPKAANKNACCVPASESSLRSKRTSSNSSCCP